MNKEIISTNEEDKPLIWINPKVLKMKEEIELLKKEVMDLKHNIEIKDKYFFMIWAIGCDYDGYNKPENLKKIIDELVEYAECGRANDDRYVKNLIEDDKND